MAPMHEWKDDAEFIRYNPQEKPQVLSDRVVSIILFVLGLPLLVSLVAAALTFLCIVRSFPL